MKTMNKTLIIFVIGVVLIICGLSLGGYEQLKDTKPVQWLSHYDWDNPSISDFSKEFDIDEIKDLNLEIENAEIIIKEEKRENILLKVFQSNSHFEYDVDHDCLKIEQSNSWQNKNNSLKLYIYIPTGFQFEEVIAEAGVGKLSISSINAKKIDLEVGAGQLEVKKVSCEKELDIDCGLGDISVELVDSLSKFAYNIDCGMGNVTIGDDHYSGVAQSKTSHHNQHKDRKINIDCGMGNVTIKED